MRFLKNSVVLTIMLVSLPVWGHEILTLDQAIGEVLKTNPDVRAARLRMDEARAKIPQAVVPPDPSVGVMFEQVPLGTTDVTQGAMTRYQLKQDLPFPSKLYERGRIASLDARAVSEESRGLIETVISDLKSTYYDIYRLDRTLQVNHDTQKILKLFAASTESRYAAGDITADAPLKAQVELSKLENEEIGLNQERLTHMSHLQAILNHAEHHDPVLPETLEWPLLHQSLDEIKILAQRRRPELKKLDAMKDRERAKLSKARQGLIPDLSIGLEYDRRLGMQDAWTGQAMLNVPIFFWARNRGEMKEAKASYQATLAEQQSMEVHTAHEIEQAYSAVQAATQQVQTYEKKLLPAAKITLGSAETAYATGKIDFMTLIDAARTYKDLQMGHFQTQARLGQSFAMLERLVGMELHNSGGHHD